VSDERRGPAGDPAAGTDAGAATPRPTVAPGRVEPGRVQPVRVPPGGVPPGGLERGRVEPGSVGSASVGSGHVPPGGVQPGRVQPGRVGSGRVEPGRVEPGRVEPGRVEPAGGDPGLAALSAARAATRRRGTGQPGAQRVAGRRGRQDSRRGGYSGAGADERDPQRLGVLVGRLLADRGWERTAATAGVLARWEAIVGAGVAARCQPVSLRDGELTLAAESTAWATQLRSLVPRLLGRIRAEVGPDVVTRIRVHGPTGPTWGRGPRRVAGRGPRDTYG
jgi:predicted nucleic acid-binding Zn ribbon protein